MESLMFKDRRIHGAAERYSPFSSAIMAALIVDTDEGDARGVAMDTPAQRDALIARYEQEVRRDNGGLLRTEVEAFCEAHLVLASDQQMLLRICRDSISAPQYAPDRYV